MTNFNLPDYDAYGDPLAPPERVAARIPSGVVSEDDINLLQEMILQASDEVRTHGRPSWTSANVPPQIVSIVVEAAARGYMNPEGIRREDADAGGLERGGRYVQGAELTPSEIRRVKMAASRSGFGFIQGSKPSNWSPRSNAVRAGDAEYVPWGGAGRGSGFPFFKA